MPKQPRKPPSTSMPRKVNTELGLQNVPYHITVEKKRKAVDVQSWGSAPFALDDHKNIIPHGFSVKTYYKGKWFVASTRVCPAAAAASAVGGTTLSSRMSEEYRFICETEPICFGEWSPTSSAALQSVVTKLGSRIKCARGSNGALQIGVTYPNVQHAIRQIFALQDRPTFEKLAMPRLVAATIRETSEDAVDSSAVIHHEVSSSSSSSSSSMSSNSTDEDDGGCEDTQSSPSVARSPSPTLPSPPLLIAQVSHEHLQQHRKRVKHEDEDVDPVEAQFAAKLHDNYFLTLEDDDPLMLLGTEDSCDWFHSLMQ